MIKEFQLDKFLDCAEKTREWLKNISRHRTVPCLFPIYSIQNASGVEIQSIWTTIEYQLLQGKEIIYGVVSQSGSIQILP